ncbi:hypothetical protein [Actinoallomurus soli]|uniref:hypothetical protein n=1 Tax=Actinoallomurus soli TaxID=2952535 RepID=UPI002093417C|nr:hypothetical protein [Actinoallomurus soli]MCO5974927.1 hypothetical protein [Actinoallomurus soli]
MNTARELLAIAADDEATAIKVADLMVQTVKDTRRLPDAEVVRRKVRTGQDLSTRLTLAQ